MENVSSDSKFMLRAIELAYRGLGRVEPNPMVGCVVVRDGAIVSEGYHQHFGGPHAEVEALNKLPASAACESTIYVTLEPCNHFGKTPPCVERLLSVQPQRVVIGIVDPFPAVAGQGIVRLRESGIEVDIGIEREACERLLAAYLKRQRKQLPWVIAKWAMTLDGRMATAKQDSKWISGETSRRHAHATRGRMDAIGVGIETALLDDPLLTARPAGSRVATRIVFDSLARLPISSQLVRTAKTIPTLIVCGPEASDSNIEALRSHGCDVWIDDSSSRDERGLHLMHELARRGHTNLLVEGGPKIIGSFFDQKWIDEVHVYVAAKLVGGSGQQIPNFGTGIDWMKDAIGLADVTTESFDGDFFIRGFCRY